MGRGTKTTEFLKECMADALLRLMREMPVEKISITQITEKAGVGRATWFRNFTSKNEAVTFKLIRLWDKWAEEHELFERHRYTLDNAVTFFEFNYSIQNILDTIYRAGLQSAVYDSFYQVMSQQFDETADECYQIRFYSYGLFGLLDEWVKRKYCESPQEMAEIVWKISGHKNFPVDNSENIDIKTEIW